MNVGVNDHSVTLFYKYMEITQSSKIWSESKDILIKKVDLADGKIGEWINGKDHLPRNRFFRIQLNESYVTVDDYRYLPEEQVQAIVESFGSIKDLK